MVGVIVVLEPSQPPIEPLYSMDVGGTLIGTGAENAAAIAVVDVAFAPVAYIVNVFVDEDDLRQ